MAKIEQVAELKVTKMQHWNRREVAAQFPWVLGYVVLAELRQSLPEFRLSEYRSANCAKRRNLHQH